MYCFERRTNVQINADGRLAKTDKYRERRYGKMIQISLQARYFNKEGKAR